ncbi:MAG: porin [Acinetobacter sp.]|nr:MAG: porin [Acinetobacter sp.]
MELKGNLMLVMGVFFTSVSSSVFAAPTLYGVLDGSVNFASKDIGHNQLSTIHDGASVTSNNSYLGVKGNEKLSDTLSIVYDAQWTINIDGDGSDFGQRDRYLGLKHEQLGTLSIGKLNTFLKRLGSIDLFDNYAANQLDIANTFTGENRINDGIQYQSPAIKVARGKINANLQLFQGEGGVATNSGNAVGDGFGDAISASILYDNKAAGVNFALAYDSAVPSRWIGAGNAWAETNTVRAVANMQAENLSLSALLQHAEVAERRTASNVAVADIESELGFALGVLYKVGQTPWSVKGQFQQGTTTFKTAHDIKAQQMAVGVDYQYNSNAKAYFYLAQHKLKDDDNRVGGLGLQYKF